MVDVLNSGYFPEHYGILIRVIGGNRDDGVLKEAITEIGLRVLHRDFFLERTAELIKN